MVTKEELQNKYTKLTIEELLIIIDNKHDYTDLAVSVAISELAKRNIAEEQISNYKAKQVDALKKYVRANVVDDLKLWQKLLYYIFFLPILNFPFRRNLAEDGYALKLKQATYYCWAGFWGLLVAAVLTIDAGSIRALLIWGILFIIAYIYNEQFNRQKLINKLNRIFTHEQNDRK